jgi:hypothetical protein
MVTHTCNVSTQETEARRINSSRIIGANTKTLSKKKKKRKEGRKERKGGKERKKERKTSHFFGHSIYIMPTQH